MLGESAHVHQSTNKGTQERVLRGYPILFQVTTDHQQQGATRAVKQGATETCKQWGCAAAKM